MQNGKAFFIVGHKHWGKSKTLSALTDGRRPAWFTINSHLFFIRRMSNDDIPDDFYELLNELDSTDKPFVIIALCPTFEDEKEREKLVGFLKDFKRKYQLFFFVLRHAYGDHQREITNSEVRFLKELGTVEVFSQVTAEKEQRAKALKKFIQDIIVRTQQG